MALDTRTDLSLKWTLTKSLDGPITATTPFERVKSLQLTSGTGAGKADLLWFDERTLTASSTEDLDLVGTLTDAFGATFSPARIKALYVEAAAGNSNNVIVGNATANAWSTFLGATGTITLRPGFFNLLGGGVADATGYTVTAGTGDLLKVANSAGSTSVTYFIAVVGVSA